MEYKDRSYYLKVYDDLADNDIDISSYGGCCSYATNVLFSERNLNNDGYENPVLLCQEYIELYKSKDIVLNEIKELLKESNEGVQLDVPKFLYLSGALFHIDECLLLLADYEKIDKYLDHNQLDMDESDKRANKQTISVVQNAVIANLNNICKGYSLDLINDIVMSFYSSDKDFIDYICEFLEREFKDTKVTPGVFYILVNAFTICINSIQFRLVDDVEDPVLQVHSIMNEVYMWNRVEEKDYPYIKIIPICKNVIDSIYLLMAHDALFIKDTNEIEKTINETCRRSCTKKENHEIVSHLLRTIFNIVNK